MKRTYIIACLLLLPAVARAQTIVPALDAYVRGRAVDVSEAFSDDSAGMIRSVQRVQFEILDGEEEGEVITLENGIPEGREDLRIREGDTMILQRLQKPDGTIDYLIREPYRLRALLLLTLFFFGLGVLCGGRAGFRSLLGLSASIAIIALFIVPRIAAGGNPLFVSFTGAMLVAATSLFLAHGFHRRTLIAFQSTILTLVLSMLLAIAFVEFASLFGLGTEESVFLQLGPLAQVNLRGLLLGGIVIGALGVLDDITTAQTAAIDELSKANHALGFAELYSAGTSIGREHIASLINTLALAYVGASLPLLLLLSLDSGVPLWVTLNSEFFAEEIVRTLVGSSTLLLAVPISTWFAARAFAHGRHTNASGGHAHHH